MVSFDKIQRAATMLTLVTGSTGLVGNNVVRLLLERGDAVRVLLRGSGDTRCLDGLKVEVALGDVRNADSVRAASVGVQRIVHAAATVHIGWKGLETQRDVNVAGTRNVAAAAREVGARLAYVSSVNALGLGSRKTPADEETPLCDMVPCPYVLTKREAEQEVLAELSRGLDAVIVNPTFMLGPWDWKPSSGRMMLQVATGWAKLAPPGGNDFCDVRDVAQGILAALDKGARGRRYILGGEPLSFLEAWTMFAKIVRVAPPWRLARRPGLWLVGSFGDAWGRITGREPDMNSAAVAMSRLEHHYSYARAADELGYRPRPRRKRPRPPGSGFRPTGMFERRQTSPVGRVAIQFPPVTDTIDSQHVLRSELRENRAASAKWTVRYFFCKLLRNFCVMEKELSDRVNSLHERILKLRDSL